MPKSPYIEDIFLDFYEAVLTLRISIQHQDRSAASSFYTTIVNGNALTKNQGNYILRILEKYKNTMAEMGIDYIKEIKEPNWAQPFRVIDMSRRVFVEQNENKEILVCLKFPYQLLEAFDTELFPKTDNFSKTIWDQDRKLRTVNIYDANLIQIYDFCKKYEFEIDDSFMVALSEIEEIWQNQESILSKCTIQENSVVLLNVSLETQKWFDENKNGNINNDLFLAKSMGILYDKIPNSPIEKIASKDTNIFYWGRDPKKLFELCLEIEGKIAILIDRSQEALEWIKHLTDSAERAGFTNEEIKVGFRSRANDHFGLNEWIADKGYGGGMTDGKIYIFNHKPPKWLFKDKIPVTMLITNELMPSSTRLTRDWISGHPCVIYVGEFEPTLYSETKIGKL